MPAFGKPVRPLLFFSLCAALVLPGRASEVPYVYPDGPAPAGEVAAYSWLVGATVLPVAVGAALDGNVNLKAALILGGLLIGPSAGEFYAGSPGRALAAITGRLVGSTLMVLGLMQTAPCQDCETPDTDRGFGVGRTGLAIYALSTAFSLVDTHFAVRRNYEAITGRRADWSPSLDLASDGRLAYGARIRMRF